VTRRVATPDACFTPGHGHVVLARRRPLELDGDPPLGPWITVWLCPVRRQLSAVLEDGRAIDPARRTGGPLADL
jgi:hypothetical protein